MPEVPVLIGWVLVGWCGTVPRPRPPFPPPPDPDPWWRNYLVGGILAVIGGVVGGYAFDQLFSVDLATTGGVLLSLAGAFVGGRLAGDIGGLAMGARG